ncbi:MAG: hypothetical protein NZ932_04095 [Candidatus Bathyarchaeota archaeon]|nr:hypothetical protein [Candidatus Bathyarchaeota archaeon]MDW8022349.1 hypothetical protein [Nitrososphaerota archaeon]
MQTVTKVTIALVVASALLDLATSEVLLSVGSVNINGKTIVFHELNPLFHVLGRSGFIAVSLILTALVSYALILYEGVCLKHGAYRTHMVGCIAVIILFVIPHLILGFNNLMLIARFVH